MGSACSCCSICSRRSTISINSKNEERQAMLDVGQQVQQETSNQSGSSTPTKGSPKPEYGSVKEYSPPKAPESTGDVPSTKTTASESSSVPEKESHSGAAVEVTESEREKTVHRIPTSQTNVIITNAGFDDVNGEYRWFVHSSKWCLFKEGDSYSMENGVSVDDVYSQLAHATKRENADFRWESEVEKCWTITNLDGSVIYYAAPHLQTKESAEYIPNDKGQWITVHGSSPSPNIFPDTTKSNDELLDEPFGNAAEAEKEDNGCKPSLQPIAESEDQNTENASEPKREEVDDEEGDDGSLSDMNEDDEDDDESLSEMD